MGFGTVEKFNFSSVGWERRGVCLHCPVKDVLHWTVCEWVARVGLGSRARFELEWMWSEWPLGFGMGVTRRCRGV